MPSITIDGKTFEFEGKKMILDIALENKNEIPHYCYHPGLSVVASCRICLAEVEAPNPRNDNKVELIPKLVPTCQTPAADGMIVHTKSDKSAANQKMVMEYLLINHPLDCPVCDQAGECKLQDYSYDHGRAESRFLEEKIKQPTKDIGPHVKLYSDRCIMCSRCIRFTREVSGTSELAVFGRGAHEQVDVFPGQPLDNELSGNVVDICPVGALLDKDFLFEQRVWLLQETPSIDGITCSGDNISIHQNEGKIYRIKPRENMEVNTWWTSDEIRHGWDFVHSDERHTTPKRKQLGDLFDSDWPKAISEAADTLKQTHGDEGDSSLAVMISPMLSCEEAYVLGQLVRGMDPAATLAVGPVPIDGQDKTFPGGYTIYAEKCPNARGVRRALELLTGDKRKAFNKVDDYETFIQKLSDKTSPIKAVLLTGNYPSAWATKELITALKGKKTILIDTLSNDLTTKADVLLPSATWAEKAGTFENVNNRLQTFQQALPVLEGARPEGQIAFDLAAAAGLMGKGLFDPATVRQKMDGVFVTEVHEPVEQHACEPDMQYVEL
jgi:NADH-quinone oxidoreductase subunit G